MIVAGERRSGHLEQVIPGISWCRTSPSKALRPDTDSHDYIQETCPRMRLLSATVAAGPTLRIGRYLAASFGTQVRYT